MQASYLDTDLVGVRWVEGTEIRNCHGFVEKLLLPQSGSVEQRDPVLFTRRNHSLTFRSVIMGRWLSRQHSWHVSSPPFFFFFLTSCTGFFFSSLTVWLTPLFHLADVLVFYVILTSALISRAPSQGVSPPPGRAMGSVSAGRAAALSARRSDGCQPAKRRGSHTAAASTNSRRHQAPGASHTVRLSAQRGHLRERHRQMNRCLADIIYAFSAE